MKLRILKSFRDKLNEQVEYIAKDKPGAARKFKTDVLKRFKKFLPCHLHVEDPFSLIERIFAI